MTRKYLTMVALCAFGLAACGGGGGGGSTPPTTVSAAAPPLSTPTPTTAPTTQPTAAPSTQATPVPIATIAPTSAPTTVPTSTPTTAPTTAPIVLALSGPVSDLANYGFDMCPPSGTYYFAGFGCIPIYTASANFQGVLAVGQIAQVYAFAPIVPPQINAVLVVFTAPQAGPTPTPIPTGSIGITIQGAKKK